MDVFEEKLDKMDATGKAYLGKMEANIETCQEPREVKSNTDSEEVEATGLEANREKSEVIAVHQEVPNEEPAVETIRALEVRSGCGIPQPTEKVEQGQRGNHFP
jgi:hypothetical protein